MNTIVITGASRGVGLEFVRQYSHVNSRIVAACRQPAHSAPILALSNERSNIVLEELDLTDQESITRFAKRLESMDTQLDLLINNAGTAEHEPFGQWTKPALDKTFATNVSGPSLLMQELAPLLSKGSKVVNLSSGLASLTRKGGIGTEVASYAASKAALNMMTVHAAAALRANDITVVAISPGWVKTDMGGPDASSDPADAVALLRKTISALSFQDSGAFLQEDGSALP
ncbi:SDR family oxidoreductase [Pelagicoccus sp. SDUM812003]|uniref:SDR family oxidoreductase n=1 Tax=Pelagicoccus sp. SDUM812003 TaxID=3041267 RepID=UPI00280D91B7|nr:SDR family oxidoreductase [Pelagicoccus sp. SDUM812003]MDQ8201461.1 SDR family oxidoreductase [Pelagicoccus sp. SDUM812003]